MGQGAYSAADLAAPPAQTGTYSAADLQGASSTPNGPTIGPRPANTHPTVDVGNGMTFQPPTTMLEEGLAKLKDWAGLTQEGRTQHPLQAAVGDFADKVKQMVVGGQGHGLDMKTGFANNPVTSALIANPGEAIDTAAVLADKGVSAVGSVRRAVAAAPQAVADSGAARAVSNVISPQVAENATVAQMRGAGTTGGAATTSITNNDVLKYAADNGIKMTPAQRTLADTAKSEQALGEEAFGTGSMIKEAVNKEKAKLSDIVESLQDKVDPARVGVSPEAVGEHLQKSVTDSRAALKKSVNDAYDQVDAKGAELSGNIQNPLSKFLYEIQNRVNPSLGMSRPVTQTAGAKAAIEDIEKLMTDPGLQGDATPVENMRNLRTTLLEKANDYGVNKLSDSGQRIYKLAVSKVDAAIVDAAKGTSFEDSFRTAGEQNAKLQELYNDSSSPLYRVLNQDDPAKIANGIITRKSAHELEVLKGEGIDVGPVARHVVEDIKNGGFRITKNGLGGYSDSFLNSLLGPDATKELYTQGEISRRLVENYNPSRSGRVLLGAAQSVHPVIGSVFSQGARIRSMPEDVAPFLPQSPITGGPLATPAQLFKKTGTNP